MKLAIQTVVRRGLYLRSGSVPRVKAAGAKEHADAGLELQLSRWLQPQARMVRFRFLFFIFIFCC